MARLDSHANHFRPGMSVRTWAALLALCATVPLLVFGWAAIDWMTRTNADALAQHQAAVAAGVANVVDSEIQAWKAAVSALATSQVLQTGRFAEFYAEAKAVAAQHDGWIVLTAPSGQQLVNTLRPYGDPLPFTSTPELLPTVLKNRTPIVTDLVFGKVAQRWILAVAVPVMREGQAVYMLDMALTTERLTRLLQRHPLPAEWSVAIVDSQNRIITGVRLPEERIGQGVLPWISDAIRSADSGIVAGGNQGRIDTRIAFDRIAGGPWTAIVQAPAASIPSPLPAYWLTALAILLAGSAVLAFLLASRKLTRPVAGLAARAEKILRGDAPEGLLTTGVRELQHLEQALVRAATSVQALHREQARAAAAETRAAVEAESAEALRAEIAQRRQTELALQEALAKLNLHIENTPLAVVEWGPDSRLIRWSRSAERLFGWSADEVLGKKLDEFRWVHDEDVPHVERVSAGLVDGGTPQSISVNRNYRKDGTVVHCEWHNSALWDTSGNLRSILSLVLDVTDRTRAEEALLAAHVGLERRVEARTVELAQAVATLERQSEQLRTLASELTLAEQRERRRLADILHENLQQLLVGARLRVMSLEKAADAPSAQATCREAAALLDEAVDCSRTLTGELSPPILREAGLAPALQWLCHWMQERHGLQVVFHGDGSPLLISESVTLLLFHSARELLLNVVKHARVPAASLDIAAAQGQVHVTITDAGVGFDAPVDLDMRLGTGFGIFSIRQRLEFLGGRMVIDSTPGHGCRVTLSAPLLASTAPPADAVTVPAEMQDERREEQPARVGHRIRLLLVDDHALVRESLARLLEIEPDFEVVGQAGDGKVAVDMTRTLQPDVVLMDVSMPVMNGIEATAVIHAEFPDIPIIGLSMFDAREFGAAIQAAGASAYVAKNDAGAVLVETVRACVGRR